MAHSRLDPSAKAALQALRIEGEPDPYLELARVFITTSDKFVEELKTFTNESHRTMLVEAAHAWKSSAASMGAKILAELCKDLETRAAVDDSKSLQTLIKEIEAEYQGVRSELGLELKAGA